MNLIEVKNISKTYKTQGSFLGETVREVHALKNISFEIKKGEVMALVGESGSGKSTLGNCILKLLKPDCGEILFEGQNILNFNSSQTLDFRKKTGLIFQNPYSSLNPKMKIFEILSESLSVHRVCPKKEYKDRVAKILLATGLGEDDMKRYPHEFSGGQRQRIAISRALILNPVFVVADEPVSALDVSIQAQILNLLKELKNDFNLTYLFISHDLNVVRYISDRVIVLYKGEIVEKGITEDVFNSPKHDYTKTLLSAIPSIEV